MREIELISTSDGYHTLYFGLNNNEISDFSIQLWIEKFGTRAVDWLQDTSLGYIAFMGGDLWIANSDSVPRANLFGEQKDVVIGVVANEEPTRVKLLDSIGIDSNSEWEVSEVIIPASLSYPNGMYSKIPSARFKKRDGIWQAQFLRNMKTNQSAASAIDAIKGEPLRGNEAYLVLTNVNNPDGEQVKLFKIAINMTSSRV